MDMCMCSLENECASSIFCTLRKGSQTQRKERIWHLKMYSLNLDQFRKSCWMSKCSIWTTIPKYSVISYSLFHFIPLQYSSQRQLDKIVSMA